MKLPQLSLRELFWLITVMGLSIGWWLDHEKLARSLTDISEKYKYVPREFQVTVCDEHWVGSTPKEGDIMNLTLSEDGTCRVRRFGSNTMEKLMPTANFVQKHIARTGNAIRPHVVPERNE
jgi:hypothetical protein